MRISKARVLGFLLLSFMAVDLESQVCRAETDEIPLDRLRNHLYFLACDYLGGRVTGSVGYRIAAEYAASQFTAAGLMPIAPDNDEHAGYFQPVPIPRGETGSHAVKAAQLQGADGATRECYNVIGYIPGADPDLKREFVVVSAHLDHIPPQSGEICNGADDNASGCTAVLEIATRLASEPLDRSVIFVLFTGEDYSVSPRLGSRYFLEHWPRERGRIFVNVNIDMIGREDTTWPKPGAITIMDSESVCPKLRSVCAAVNEKTRRLQVHFDVSTTGASDDRSFADVGIPSLGLFCGVHPDLHKPSDEVDKISFPRIQQVAGLGLELTRALGSRKTSLCE